MRKAQVVQITQTPTVSKPTDTSKTKPRAVESVVLSVVPQLSPAWVAAASRSDVVSSANVIPSVYATTPAAATISVTAVRGAHSRDHNSVQHLKKKMERRLEASPQALRDVAVDFTVLPASLGIHL